MEKSARVSVRHPGVQRIVEATECSGIEDKYPGTDSGEADSGLSFPEHFMMHLALLCHRGSGARWRSPRRKKAVSLHAASGATACTVSIPPGCTVQYLKECIADATSVLPVLLQVRELSQRRAVDGTTRVLSIEITSRGAEDGADSDDMVSDWMSFLNAECKADVKEDDAKVPQMRQTISRSSCSCSAAASFAVSLASAETMTCN